MHVVVQVVISLLAKLDFLEVHLDANVADKDIFERQVLLQTIGALVGDIAEGVEQLFSPVFEQWDLRQESLTVTGGDTAGSSPGYSEDHDLQLLL